MITMRYMGNMILKFIICTCMVLNLSCQVGSLSKNDDLNTNQVCLDTTTGLFRDQLDSDSKLCYDALEYMYAKNYMSINNINFRKLICKDKNGAEINFRFYISGVECRKNGTPTNNGKSKINLLMQKIFTAFVYDHPQYYWLNDFHFKVSEVKVHDTTLSNAKYFETLSMNVSLKAIYWEGVYPDKYGEFNNSVARYSEICFNGTNSTYDKVKNIHDMLCKNVVYTEDKSSEYEQTPIDIFLPEYAGKLNKQEGVCEAYSKAFKILCMKANIPCMIAVGYGQWGNEGGNHAWNMVKLDDGQWYAVDTTWDDLDNGYVHEFFLNGYNTMVLRQPFSSTHQLRKLELVNGNFCAFEFLYPKLASERYVA